jgi:trigger factor
VAVDIFVPGKATQAAYDKVCTELSKQIQIPGFRKGSRIPPAVLEQNMAAKGGRNAMKVQAIQELVGQLVEPALKEQALDPIGQPVLKVSAEELAETFVAGQPLTLQVQCDVWPDIQWKTPTTTTADKPVYVGLKGKYTRKPFNQEKLDLALRDLKERYATLEPIENASQHALQMGDACTVNMNGYLAVTEGTTVVKGDPLPNAASGDRVEVILGTGRYMEGLVEGLIGAKVGDTVTVVVNFPEVSVVVVVVVVFAVRRIQPMNGWNEMLFLSSWMLMKLYVGVFFFRSFPHWLLMVPNRNSVIRRSQARKPFSTWKSWKLRSGPSPN